MSNPEPQLPTDEPVAWVVKYANGRTDWLGFRKTEVEAHANHTGGVAIPLYAHPITPAPSATETGHTGGRR